MRETLSFLLYDWLNVESLNQRSRYADHNRETFDSVLDTSERIALERFAPFNRHIDTEEPQFDGTHVSMPEVTQKAIDTYRASGLLAAGHDYEVGGMQLPYVIDMAANTFFAMASISLSGFAMLTYANANLLMAQGTDRQRQAFALPQLEGRYLGTMCLSEPQAGSSLGDIQTRAVPDGAYFDTDHLGPRYRLTGNKMWISGGEHELSENIIHLVLAKIPDSAGKLIAGVKGISLFVVPRLMIDANGKTSTLRNDVALAGLNHKLGYRGIPNTLLNFGEGRFPVGTDLSVHHAGAIGYRIGDAGTGLQSMFHMMNEARINVGMGATMLGYAGYQASLDYARNRLQGRPSNGAQTNGKAQIQIIQHTDVKRMLLAQKAYCEGALALGLYCARLVDEKRTGSTEAASEAASLLELLTPIAKSWPSEWCLEANSLAIQVHGGYGYTRDFPVEQYWRDNRLNMIHEGTHGIQANDLLGRKLLADGGLAMKLLSKSVETTVTRAKNEASLQEFSTELASALTAVCSAAHEAWSTNDRASALANSTPYLQAFGHMVLAWIWLDVALTAHKDSQFGGARHQNFYDGKLQTTRYFFRHELPKIYPWLHLSSVRDSTCLDMQDAWF